MVSRIFEFVHEVDFLGLLLLAVAGLTLARIVPQYAEVRSPMPAAIAAFVAYLLVGVIVLRPEDGETIFVLLLRGVLVVTRTMPPNASSPT